MKPLFSIAVVTALAGALMAPAPSHAGPGPQRRGGGNFGGIISQNEIEDRTAKEFESVRRGLLRDYKEHPKYEVFLANVNRTEESFGKNAKAVLTRPGYGAWEFDHLGRQVKIVITALREANEIDATYEDNDPRKQAAINQSVNTAQQALKDADIVTFQALRGLGVGQGLKPDGAIGGVVDNSLQAPHNPNTRERRERGWWADMTPEEALANSTVVRLGDECAKAAVEGKDPVVTPPPVDPVKPEPIVVGPGNGAGSGTMPPAPATPVPAPPPIDIITPIYSPGGRSQSYVDQGAGALKDGEYARAAALARKALALDVSNRSALAILHVAKGRDGAVEGGDAGSQVARAGAGALAGNGYASAGAIGGRLSPEMAALSRSGAARLAQDQAVTGAQNALKLRDAGGAVAILSKALAQDPDNALLLHYRALAYGRLGRWDDALKDTAAGLRAAPGNKALLGVQALAQNRTRRWRDALASSEALLAADPRSAWAYAARAHARGGLGDRDGMLADINRAAALDPSFQRAAAEAAELQLPSDSDALFLFPGEPGKTAAPAAAPAGRGRGFSVVVVAAIAGGLLFALGLLSVVLAPVKDSVVSVFTKARRTGPATGPVATAQPASAAGFVAGLIRGQYEISRQIGQGGMGTVYEGTDRSLGRRVAIKKMRDELRLNARERDRFVIEAKTVASLHHPAIVDIYAIAEEGDDVYLVFEYVDGKTVHDLVQTKGRLDPAETLRVTRAMGEALTYAHSRGVIHRDMKPSNVMLTSAGQVKVMDFGIARMAKDAMTRYSMTNTVVGTPPYMAPEQEQGVVRKESDVYSLAICAYEMLTGKLPFIGMGAGMLMNKINMSYIPPSRAIAGLPEALDEVFQKAFHADPEKRHRTPQEFTAALESSLGGARSKAGPV